MEFVTLNNGVEMPLVGYGVYRVDPAECERCVHDALEVGYRSIDTAQMYQNEEGVGAAVRKSGIPRDELFITTKVWVNNAGEKKAAASIDESLRKLQTDYADLILIHQPFGDYYGTYRALEQALKAGKTRAIGLSNFYADRLVDLCEAVDVIPAVDQLETHVFYMRSDIRPYLDELGIIQEAWGPLAQAKNGIFTNPILTIIGQRHGKTAAQVALRYLTQRGIVVIPKSTHKERMAENLAILDFTLDENELEAIATLNTETTVTFSHYDPANIRRIWHLMDERG